MGLVTIEYCFINGMVSKFQFLTFVCQTTIMRIFKIFIVTIIFTATAVAQTPKTFTSSEILQQIKKLDVLGSVLYLAAHPDDENTRLLAYLANEKLYRTGYLCLTRGDGGQNLIGDEQGIDLGLIRTQELLAARRIDGAEQFFSRAFDFGFSKSSDEALNTWGHDKILSDAVWVIRKFKPDVIIARFPEDSRAGHGHHAASGIIAREAFVAATDPNKFPEQLTQGVTVWQAKRMLWNTFNFGGNSTQREDQFKMDVGMYNPLLGKSYGEMAAQSRSQHRSQGFGVPAQRGTVIEYFETIKGNKPTATLLDEVDVSWGRAGEKTTEISGLIKKIIEKFDAANPAASLPDLLNLNTKFAAVSNSFWKQQKQQDLAAIIQNCSGLFLEATASSEYAVQGDSMKITITANNRLGYKIDDVIFHFRGADIAMGALNANSNSVKLLSVKIAEDEKLSQPYWLESPMDKGSFNVSNQQLIGKAENEPMMAVFTVSIEGQLFSFDKPIRYKFTDPVKGELYQPVAVVPQFTMNLHPSLTMVKPGPSRNLITKKIHLFTDGKNIDPDNEYYNDLSKLNSGEYFTTTTAFDIAAPKGRTAFVNELDEFLVKDKQGKVYSDIHEIKYDHIPTVRYFIPAKQKILKVDVAVAGNKAGYINGAGDKIPEALEGLGYKVTALKEADITAENLKQFDVLITGIRAFNTNAWMGNVHDVLMQYVADGGVMLTQFNTNNFISNIKSKIGPYEFNIGRNRVTNENATVNFLLPNHPALNYPNKITANDFDGWIQERSVYHAEKIDDGYQRILSMKDDGEEEQDGSLIIADYGKGKFVYTGLVFFRELPAGVPGAYRLFANLLAAPIRKGTPVKSNTMKASSKVNSIIESKKNGSRKK